MSARLRRPATARALGAFSLLGVAACVGLIAATGDPLSADDGTMLFVVCAFAAAGFVVARKQPLNPIGWLFLVAADCIAVFVVASFYAVLDFRHHGGRLPLGRVALALEPAWTLGVVCIALAVLLFPHGRLPSPRWRRAAQLEVLLGCWYGLVWSVAEAALPAGPGFKVDSVGNPAGRWPGFSGTAGGAAWLAAPFVVALSFAFVARQAVAWRRSSGSIASS